MEKQQQLTMAKLLSFLLTIIPAVGFSYILFFYTTNSMINSTTDKEWLLKSLVNVSLYAMISMMYYIGMRLILSVIFRFIGGVRKSTWPKTVAFLGGFIIWSVGIFSSIYIYLR